MAKLSQPNVDSEASAQKNVICVLSQEQYDDYEDDLSGLKAVGAILTLVDDPDEALTVISKDKPDMIIVGMELDDMEGFEFLAMLTSRVPDYENPAVVLPDKEDGLPPVVHCRKQDTGHSAVDGVDFNYITSLLYPTPSNKPDGLQKTTVASKKIEPSPLIDKPKAKPAVDQKASLDRKPEIKPIIDQKPLLDDKPKVIPIVDEKRPLVDRPETKPADEKKPTESKQTEQQPFSIDFPSDPSLHKPIPTLEEPPAALLEEQAPLLAPRSRFNIDKRYLIIGGCLSLVLVSIGGYLGLSGSSESKSLEPAGQDIKVASNSPIDEDKKGVRDETDELDQDELNPTPNTASGEAKRAADTKSADESPEEHVAEVGLELPKELILPLSFEIGSSKAEINDEQRLDKIVEALSSKENTQIVLTGHASVQGKSDINYKLGLQRAEAAKKILVDRQIPSDRIRTVSLGSDVPISEKVEEEEQQHNRRVTVTLQQIL